MSEAFSGGTIWFILLFSFSITLVGTPIARGLAHRFGIIDKPTAGGTKKHDKPVAYLGGLFIYVAFATGIFLTLNATGTAMGEGNGLTGVKLPWVFAAVTFIFLVGLTDDLIGMDENRAGMHPGIKMLMLAVAGTVLFFGGVKVGFMPWDILNYPLTIFWILGITNAANVIDNMNGISSGSGAVAGLFFFLLGMYNHDPITMGLALVLIGGTIGFLFYNFPKASIFLGDSGSITLGFFISLLGLLAGRSEVVQDHALTGTLAPIFVVMFFVFDTWFVALSRGKRKINFWWGGLDHTTHRLNNLGWSKPFVAIIIWVINFLFGLVALTIYHTATWFAVPFCLVMFFLALKYWIWLNTVPIEEVDITLLGAPDKK